MTAVRIALFGAFEVSGDGAPEAVRGTIPQAILARLAVSAATLISSCSGVWLKP